MNASSAPRPTRFGTHVPREMNVLPEDSNDRHKSGVISAVESMGDDQSVCLLDGAHARLSNMQLDRLDPPQSVW